MKNATTTAQACSQAQLHLAMTPIDAAHLQRDIESRIEDLRRINSDRSNVVATLVGEILARAVADPVRVGHEARLKRVAMLLSCIALEDI